MGAYGTPQLGTGKKEKQEFYKCKKCGHRYIKSWNYCPQCRTQKGKGSKLQFLLAILICLIIFIITKNYLPTKMPKEIIKNINQKINKQEIEKEVPESINVKEEIPSIEPPENGIFESYTNKEMIARLNIDNTNNDVHYFMKLINAKTEETILTIFINKKTTAEVMVPLGEYKIICAYGKEWYGRENLFQKSTGYKKFDYTFNFYKDEYKINGYTISLTNQVNGNLRSSYLSKNDFE